MYNGRTYNRVLCTTEGLIKDYYNIGIMYNGRTYNRVLCTTEGLTIGYYVQQKDL